MKSACPHCFKFMEIKLEGSSVIARKFKVEEPIAFQSGNCCPDDGTMLVYQEGCEHCPMPGCGYSRCN